MFCFSNYFYLENSVAELVQETKLQGWISFDDFSPFGSSLVIRLIMNEKQYSSVCRWLFKLRFFRDLQGDIFIFHIQNYFTTSTYL